MPQQRSTNGQRNGTVKVVWWIMGIIGTVGAAGAVGWGSSTVQSIGVNHICIQRNAVEIARNTARIDGMDKMLEEIRSAQQTVAEDIKTLLRRSD